MSTIESLQVAHAKHIEAEDNNFKQCLLKVRKAENERVDGEHELDATDVPPDGRVLPTIRRVERRSWLCRHPSIIFQCFHSCAMCKPFLFRVHLWTEATAFDRNFNFYLSHTPTECMQRSRSHSALIWVLRTEFWVLRTAPPR